MLFTKGIQQSVSVCCLFRTDLTHLIPKVKGTVSEVRERLLLSSGAAGFPVLPGYSLSDFSCRGLLILNTFLKAMPVSTECYRHLIIL